MSNDFFKVKKGLNIKPSDPSGLSNLQDGDIIVDSTDDNRLKVYDSVGGDFSSVGTGGSSGNILKDIEKLTPTVSNVVAVTDTVTFLPIDDNNKSVKATFSGSDGSIRYEAPASADLDGVQGVVRVWIKTDVQNLSISSTKDGVKLSTTLVSFSNKWRQYEIPVILGDANYGFEIHANGAAVGDVFIDEAVVTVDANVTKLINSVDTDWISYTPTFQGAGTPSDVEFEYKRVGDSIIIRGSFVTGTTTADEAQISLPNSLAVKTGYSINSVGSFFRGGGAVNARGGSILATGEDTFLNFSHYFIWGNQAAAYDPLIPDSGNDSFGSASKISFTTTQIPIESWSTGRTEVVNQQTELTAETANVFSARVTNTGVVSEDTYDFINGNCVVTDTSLYECTFNNMNLTQPPVCTAELVNTETSADIHAKIHSVSTTSVFVRTWFSTTTNAFVRSARAFDLICTKTESDLNKSQTIVGKFANINDTPLCQVNVLDNSAETITGGTEDIGWVTLAKDNCGAMSKEGNNGAGNYDTYTAQKDGLILVNMGINHNQASTIMSVYVDGTNRKVCHYDGAFSASAGSCIVEVSTGEKLTFRINTTATLSSGTTQGYLTITELPDLSAIVDNLADNPRAARSDQYSESEIKWGLWNGEQLYRRCFSGLTTDGTVLVADGVNVINQFGWYQNATNTARNPFPQTDVTNQAFARWESGNGIVLQLSTTISDIEFCIDYTK